MNELDELIKRRTEKVKLMQADGDNSHETLAKLYGNPTHFITELLQNAEDEGAKNVEFKLTETELVFSHDAKKLFDFNDIRAISNFGDNHEKKEKPNAIGRFGIGFKSVYSITDQPRIISADYDITISDYNIPQHTDRTIQNHFNGTRIILPFKADIKLRTYELLQKELQDLNLDYLLFLSNISSIKWVTGSNAGIYERTIQKKDKRFISLTTDTKEKRYFLLEKPVELDGKKLSIKIAFQLNEKRSVIPCAISPLFVFFPTKIETNLKFLVHAPFYTTPARENIQENDNLINIEADHRNEELKKALGKLLAESLSTFKSMKLLNVELLEVLPIDKDNCNRSTIYKELYNSVKDEFTSNKELIPNSTGGFSAAKDSMLLGSSDLADLLTKKQAHKLFGRNFWINKNITNDKTKKLRDYIRNDLDIPEYDLTSFASKIDQGFMLEQSDNWIIQFYKVVHKANALWRGNSKPFGILRSKPIIRIENKNEIRQVLPFQTDGKPNVFLPTKEHTKYATVKNNIAKNKEARKFLEDLGLTTPDLFAELNRFVIPKLRSGEIYPEYFDDFKKILEAIQSTSQEKRNHLVQDLRNCPFLLGINIETGETKLLKHNEVYIQTELLKKLYLANDKVFFVAEEQYALTPIIQKHFKYLLKEFAVVEQPIRIQIINQTLTTEYKDKLREKSDLPNRTWDRVIDYELDCLQFFFNNITYEKSLALWEILSSVQNDYFLGKYEWTNYSSYTRTKTFTAKFVGILNNNAWLYDKSNNLVSPKEINFSQLTPAYQNSILSTFLEFKPDEITAIEKRTGGKFISKEEYAAYEKFKKSEVEKEVKKKPIETEEDDRFIPEYKPNEATVNSRVLEDSPIDIEFKSGQGTNPTNNDDESNNEAASFENEQENQTEKPSQKLLNGIGDYGESCVHIDLANEFANDTTVEIIDLNKSGQKGVGCDFIIKQNGEIIRIVEVKTTVEKFGQILSISGTQWEVARNFFNQSNGEKYWLYCVFNAGQENAEIVKIQNPIQKWKDGKLLAHPVNFIIK